MIKVVGAFEAKTHMSRLLDAVERGERIIITRRGKRVAELVRPQSVEAPRKVRKGFGCARSDKFYMAPDFDAPLEEFKDYM